MNATEEKSAGNLQDEEGGHLLLKGRKLVVVFSSFMMAYSLIALDQTIISTALPTIASRFDAVSNISWIASGYFLPMAAFMLFFGKVLSIAPAKSVFLFSIVIFEVGSLFCAVAPSVEFLIFGRTVSGVGASGLWVSIMSIIAQVTTIAQRPTLMGIFGAVYAVSSIIGPLLGGVFSDRVSWRWCFYINLPVGGVAILAVFFFLPFTPAPVTNGLPFWRKALRLDWMGTFLSVTMVTMLLLALQWGGNQKAWNDPAVLVTLVLFGVLLVALILWEKREGENAVLLLHLFSKKSMVGACVEGFMINAAFVLGNYYLPFLYQVRGHSATHSGIDIIPFMISGVLAALVSGGIISATGQPWPFLFFPPLIASVSFGLLFTAHEGTSFARMAGYQILSGVGLGSAIQNVLVVVQAEYQKESLLVPQATATLTFMQLMGSAIALALSEAIFASKLKSEIAKASTGLTPEIIAAVLANVKVAFQLPEEQKAAVLHAYTIAIDNIFIVGIPACALGSFAALLIGRGRLVRSEKSEEATS